jgi:DNA invertase Pin-like site-specific DNA recombinase
MVSESQIRAAQYLRVSTDHQQYSLENQRAAIRAYAEQYGFTLVRTYTDTGRTGLFLQRRDAIQQLLRHVLSGTADFKVVLAYDVSRWGRFQDVDEAAHYEFLCRQAGVQVHYCAEPFTCERTLANSLMKTVKRVMAGEYSRELSIKVHDCTKQISEMGFRTGGDPGYGLRRMLVSADRVQKQILAKGERKSLQSDRVVLAPGPNNEVACVREIFRMFVDERKWPKEIALQLRRMGIPYTGTRRREWYAQAVNRILKNPKYCGASVFGRTSYRLHAQRIHHPRALWTVTDGAWPGIVDKATFDKAQMLFQKQTIHRSNFELLSALGKLLEAHGALSAKLFKEASDLPSASPYVNRFGSLSEAFSRVGYTSPRLAAIKTRRNLWALREGIVKQILSVDPGRIALFRSPGHFRPRLGVLDRIISIYLSRCFMRADGTLYWLMNSVHEEQDSMALIVRLSFGNQSTQDMFIVPDTRGKQRFRLSADDVWLRRGRQLHLIGEFVKCVESVSIRVGK